MENKETMNIDEAIQFWGVVEDTQQKLVAHLNRTRFGPELREPKAKRAQARIARLSRLVAALAPARFGIYSIASVDDLAAACGELKTEISRVPCVSPWVVERMKVFTGAVAALECYAAGQGTPSDIEANLHSHSLAAMPSIELASAQYLPADAWKN